MERKLPFQIEADKQFIRDFGTPYKDHPQGCLTILEKFPELSKIEYNGHFRNFVYFTISIEDDKPRLHNKIKKCIQKHLDRCTRYKEKHKL